MSNFANPWKQLLKKGSKLHLSRALRKSNKNKSLELVQMLLNCEYAFPSLINSSAENRGNLSLKPNLEDFLNWIQLNQILNKNSQEVNPLVYLSRSVHRYIYEKNKELLHLEIENIKTQLSPVLNITSELFNKVEKYADKLDRNIHLCFVLHAEGLLDEEISALTKISMSLVPLYIKSAKKLIKDHLKEMLEAS